MPPLATRKLTALRLPLAWAVGVAGYLVGLVVSSIALGFFTLGATWCVLALVAYVLDAVVVAPARWLTRTHPEPPPEPSRGRARERDQQVTTTPGGRRDRRVDRRPRAVGGRGGRGP